MSLYAGDNAVAPIAPPGGIDEITRQRALDHLNIIDTPPEERFDRITRLAAQLFGVEIALISLVDRERLWFKSRFGTEHSQSERSGGFCDHAIRGSESMAVRDASADERFMNHPMVTGEPNIRFYAGHTLEARGGERLGVLCLIDSHPRTITEAEVGDLRDLALWVQSELIVEHELDRAAEVQRTLLPKTLLSMPGFEIAGACAPAKSVGGDFYDWYPVSNGVAITLADVMGKGTGAAIIAATVRAVLRAGSRHGDVAASVKAAAAILEADLDASGSFVTLFHAVIESRSGVVRYVDAGHGLTMVVPAGRKAERLTSRNLPLGTGLDLPARNQHITLAPGDILVTVSDGVLDLFSDAPSWLDEVEKIARESSSAQGLVDAVMARVSLDASDDVTILVVRREA